MRVLAIDTTSDFGSLALHEDGRLVQEMPLYSRDGFSQILFEQIAKLLKAPDWELGSIDIFAAAAGPGSFTGVRVGLTAAKGLADACGKNAAGVSNLQALAVYGTRPVRGVMIDARRGEIYAAVYDAALQLISPEVVTPFPQWIAHTPPPDEIISPDFSAFRPSFPWNVPIIEQRSIAPAIAMIAERSGGSDPAAIDANYVRRSDAELFWVDK